MKCVAILIPCFVLVSGDVAQAADVEETPETDVVAFQSLWIGKHRDAPNWTRYSEQMIRDHGDALMSGARDVRGFCPNYERMSAENKRHFWIQLVAAIVKYESSFDPSERYVEASMGIDPVTGRRVVSEGLLQLSYQDERNYRSHVPTGVCDFDYPRDRHYAVTDLRRTILNPKKNLECGIAILNHQIRTRKRIVVSSGAYWSVIRAGSRHSHVAEIRRVTQQLRFCRDS